MKTINCTINCTIDSVPLGAIHCTIDGAIPGTIPRAITRGKAVLAFCMLASAQAALGQSAAPPAAPPAPAQAVTAPAGGSGNPVATCASCHGANGEGNAAAGFPRLAGQSQWYLAKQLANYADGSRNHPVMSPIAKALTPAQREQAAAAYAAMAAAPAGNAAGAGSATGKNGAAGKPGAKGATPAAALQRGATLATMGDDRLAVQSCANCHGPGGVGEAPAYPYLAGQHASYLAATLGNWQNGSRNTDPSQQMPDIARRLSQSDITAVAAWYAQQRAPSVSELQPNVAAGTLARPVPATPVSSGPGTSTPTQGVGSEQGSPTQGGTQGIGGGGGASGSGSQGSPDGAGSRGSGASGAGSGGSGGSGAGGVSSGGHAGGAEKGGNPPPGATPKPR